MSEHAPDVCFPSLAQIRRNIYNTNQKLAIYLSFIVKPPSKVTDQKPLMLSQCDTHIAGPTSPEKKNVSAALDYTLFRIYYYSAFVCIYVYLNACITCRYYLCKSGKSLFSPYCRHLTQFLRLTGLKLCRKPSTTLTKISKKRKNSSGK